MVTLRREARLVVADLVIEDDHPFSVHNTILLVG